MKYPFPGLTAYQKKILDAVGCGNYSLAGLTNKKQPLAVLILLEKGLIENCGEKVICNDRFGKMTAMEWQMPINIHYQWTQWQAEQYDKENPSRESVGEKDA